MEHLVPRARALNLLQRSGESVVGYWQELIKRGVPSERLIPHMEWTVGDLALHLVQGVEIAGQLQEGQPSPFTDMQRISEVNARLLAENPERDLLILLHQFMEGFVAVVQRFRSMADNSQVPFHAGTSFTPAGAMAMMSTELLMHSWDFAQVVGKSFKLAPEDALLMLYAVTVVMPNAIDKAAARGFRATYELQLRGGTCLRLHFNEGELSVSEVAPGGPADCRISADPTSFLLMGYGRGSQIMPILTGKVVAWGRKPWLAGKFTQLVKSP